MADSDSENLRAGDVAWKLIKPCRYSQDLSPEPLKFIDDFVRLPQAIGHLIAVQWCDSEVCNGGFHQFFGNSTGIFAPEAAEGNRAIGLVPIADLIEHCMSLLGEPFPRDRGVRNDRLDQLSHYERKSREEWDPFHELDDRYYDLMRELRHQEAWGKFASANQG